MWSFGHHWSLHMPTVSHSSQIQGLKRGVHQIAQGETPRHIAEAMRA
ncbi:hypothetical protein ARZXY2_3451 [Arthrobacter sp. ZXY-2]|nr:hypothetical protein ARZXY2_3451 [Arthrobacter sp. ZXY-2]